LNRHTDKSTPKAGELALRVGHLLSFDEARAMPVA
jgi:hypothetical protein